MIRIIIKARYKFRCYPNALPKIKIALVFGCIRVVWNDSLAFCNEQFKTGRKKTAIVNYKNYL
ncbi:MAG: helix-turn-helix domain-containing protein [Okeania sp. SIO2F4]|uniref:helix-turn-helix domain-containing protein n=1 Tax=Okeania sp. SIO2F4 TaxID=2607790 RepID=UPI00142B6674|nr:helix-turn-helix domain-containing protein [Okeania sp. SIO2F4]